MEHTPIRLAKARTLFSVYDHDRNGVLERADFEAVADNVARARSAPHEEVRRLCLSIWNELQQVADEDGDGRVSFQELLAYLDLLTHDPLLFHQQVLTLSRLLFEILDSDHDGRITQAEYIEFAGCLRFSADRRTFLTLTEGADSLSAEQLQLRLQEFYYSDRPESPGNLFFGPLVEAL
ncbi:MAG: EF-hand domain-containing protein [Candidatus Eremiobacteraeota bacterium]|nr:EF-hand domain-containing protein [Candidatus Eremiobacteraeota bacterium]